MNGKEHDNCPVCGSPIVGRIDKKFCDDYCRSSYHYKNNGNSNKIIRRMNNRLRKNRKILKHLEDLGKSICSSRQLVFMGFDFSIHTSMYINEVGETCFYCYDRGYVSKGDDFYVIIKRELDDWEM